MITSDSLITAGYKPFTQRGLKEFTNSYFQKRFDDEYGKRFYITISEYDNKDIQQRYPESNTPDFSYAPDGQFTDANGVVFDIGMHSPKSVEEMESFFVNIWDKQCCEYYEKWSEA